MQSVKHFRFSRSLLGTGILVCLSGLVGLSWLSAMGSDQTRSTAVTALGSAVLGQNTGALMNINPASVVEAGKCTKCHEKEVACWQKTKHHASLELLKGANASKYEAAAGGKTVCNQCHATPTQSAAATASVSCQSCHGGAKGWLDIHDDAEKDPGMREAIHKKCDAAGMIRAGSLYEIAKNCFNCHVVSIPALVNAGHPSSNKIELVGWSSGEVRHNFQVDKTANAAAPSLWMKYSGRTADNRRRLKYLVGLLVDLEVTLSNLANVESGKSPFAKGHAKRLKATFKDFEKAVKALGDNAPPAAVAAQKAIKDIGRISSINFKGAAGAKKALPIVQQAAQSVASGKDDALEGLDDLVKKECKPKGDVFK